MDLHALIRDLQAQKARLDRAIAALEERSERKRCRYNAQILREASESVQSLIIRFLL
jgi:hypothetical protein